MSGEKNAEVRCSNLGELVTRNLRRYFPGLYIYLEALSIAKFGLGIKELVKRDVITFCSLVNGHFVTKETTVKVLKLIFKPLLDGKENLIREALEGRVDGLVKHLSNCLKERA